MEIYCHHQVICIASLYMLYFYTTRNAVGFCKNKCLFICVSETWRDLPSTLIVSLNSYNGRNWARLKPGAQHSIQGSHTSGRNPSKWAISTAFQWH